MHTHIPGKTHSTCTKCAFLFSHTAYTKAVDISPDVELVYILINKSYLVVTCHNAKSSTRVLSAWNAAIRYKT